MKKRKLFKITAKPVYRRVVRSAILVAIIFGTASCALSQDSIKKVPYGNNPAAGNYLNVGGANLYYEIYGKGEPFVLLHGGVYGYIDEFEYFIEKLVSHYQVICVATRGHGKSEAGKEPFTYEQRASDAFKVIRHITKDSVTVLGFSDGGYSALELAAKHPELVRKLIVIGAGEKTAKSESHRFNYRREDLLQDSPGLFESRLTLMPDPKNWANVLSRLNDLYNNSVISMETFSRIESPTLIMGGDRDQYVPVENIVSAGKAIKAAQISIIPGCGHVVFYCNFPAVWEAIVPFLDIKK